MCEGNKVEVAAARVVCTQKLQAVAGEAARLEAEVLLAHVLGWERTRLFSHPETLLTARQQDRLETLVARREGGEPLAYITGQRAFWSLTFEVTPACLIPRPDTETLVEIALARLPETPVRVADLGTGCGAIAAAIAHERPRAWVLAIDRSLAALAVAQANFQRLGLKGCHCLAGDWLSAVEPSLSFDLILANPPYIAEDDPHLQDLAWEPQTALIAGSDGLAAFRTLLPQALARLMPGGGLLVEHGATQGATVRQLFAHQGFATITTHRDLAGHERVTSGVRPLDTCP